MAYWPCQYIQMRTLWVISALKLLSLTRDWRKILLFAFTPSTDCTMHLKFVILELQSPFRTAKIEITTTDGYIAEQGLGQPKSK